MNFDTLREYLSKITTIADSQWDSLVPCLSQKSYNSGENFIREGEIVKFAGFITTGLFESYYIMSNGKQAIKRFCPENTFIGPYSDLILKRKSSCFLTALEDSELIRIDYNLWVQLMDSHIGWQKIGRVIAEVEFIEREEREKQFMVNNASERLNIFRQKYPNLMDRIPKNKIAAFLGMNPVTLSRILSNV